MRDVLFDEEGGWTRELLRYLAWSFLTLQCLLKAGGVYSGCALPKEQGGGVPEPLY